MENLKKSQEPEAYTIGWILFINSKIWLDSRPLIPRTETEWWTSLVTEEIRSKPHARILDLCAGSGAIGVAVLQALPDAHVDFIEKETRHHSTIEKNVKENVSDGMNRSQILGGDLFKNAQGPYDVILSNPPYIDPEKLERVQDSVIEHEPSEALLGGERGIEIIKRILNGTPEYLSSGGILYIEHEPEQKEEINKIANSLPHSTSLMASYSSCESFKDQFDVIRYTRLVRA